MFVKISLVFATVCVIQSSYAAVPKKIKHDDTQIVFPGPVQERDRDRVLTNRHGGTNETDPCEGLNFCTVKPDDYPQELFNKMFKGKIKEPIFQPVFLMTDDRQGDPDEVDNCASTVTFEPLYKVKSQSGDWRTVVQAPEENFLQMVRLETCNEVGSSCFTSFKAPVDLIASCKQKFSVWEFLVHDGKDGSEKIKVDLPICCSCHYKPKF